MEEDTISMQEIHISMRGIQINIQEIRNPAKFQHYLLLVPRIFGDLDQLTSKDTIQKTLD